MFFCLMSKTFISKKQIIKNATNDFLRQYSAWTVMALIGCERCGRTKPPLKYIKKWPPTQDIALFLHSSTRTSMTFK